jgi:hypothetical protein
VGAAQTDWIVDAALSRLKPAGVGQRSALSLFGIARQQVGPVTPTLSGAATVTSDSVAAAQLSFGISALPPWPPWSNRTPLDLDYSVALYGISAGDRGQAQTVSLRQHYRSQNSGYWIGGAFGWIDRAQSFDANEINAGAWISFGSAQLIGTVSTARTQDLALFQATSIIPRPTAADVRVGDASLALQLTGRRFDADAALGVRTGVSGATGQQMSARGSIAMRVSPRTRVVLSAGSQLADPVRGTPQWRFVSLGVRVVAAPTRSPVPKARLGPVLAAERIDSVRVRIRVFAPASAHSVEIAGTMTNWGPVMLTHGPTGWSVIIRAAAGPHMIQVSLDGGELLVPANLPAMDDDFGKYSGFIVIP